MMSQTFSFDLPIPVISILGVNRHCCCSFE
jgi:hypothetical protein